MTVWRILILYLVTCSFSSTGMADTVIVIQNHFNAPRLTDFQLTGSQPYNYQKLSNPPEHITLNFTRPVLAEESYIEVYDLFGTQINKHPVDTHGNDMSIPLPDLRPGRYKVKWQAQCRCEQETRLGDTFRFIVGR